MKLCFNKLHAQIFYYLSGTYFVENIMLRAIRKHNISDSPMLYDPVGAHSEHTVL